MTLATTLNDCSNWHLLLTVLLTTIFIPILKRMKFGQSIREEGPQSHMKKAGTPTMGGLVFIVSIVITT